MPIWPRKKIRTIHIGPEKEKVKVKASPRTKAGTTVLRAGILEKQRMTKEKINPRPSLHHNRLSLPPSLLPTWQTVHGVVIRAKLNGTGMKRVRPTGPGASYQTFFVVDASQCATRDGLKLQPSAMASTAFETRLSKVLDVNKCPTHVILDNGCTRSMGSSFAVKRFVQAIKDSPYRGVSCWYEPVETTFTFANGQLGKSTHQLVISFDTRPPCKTTVDVLDQGRVPILFSIEQMRNLNMTIAHTLM